MYCNMFIYVTYYREDVVESKCIFNEMKFKVRHWLKGFDNIFIWVKYVKQIRTFRMENGYTKDQKV